MRPTLRTRWIVAVALAAVLCLAHSAAAQPNVKLVDFQPVHLGVAQANPMAPPTSLEEPSYEISFDAYLVNEELVSIFLDQVTMSFGAEFTPMSVNLTNQIHLDCGSGDPQPLTVSKELRPNVECRVLLLNDPRVQPYVPEYVEMVFFFQGHSPWLLEMPVVSYSNEVPRGAYLFPAKARDLWPGQYWSGRSGTAVGGHRKSPRSMFAYDMGLNRFDTDAGAWVAFHPLSPGEMINGDENEDYLVWGTPIYAMADGVVVNCEGGNIDNPPDTPESQRKPANFFLIDHGGEIANYTHLKAGSVNAGLCFIGMPILAGDYLGEVGNSGDSDFPHLHVGVERNSQSFPLLFRDAYLLDRSTVVPPTSISTADWSYVDNFALPWEPNLLWPSPFLRRDGQSGANGDRVAHLDLTSDIKVMGSRNQSGKLDLRVWHKLGDGELSEAASEVGDGIQQVVLVEPSITSFFISAVRTKDDELRLIEWSDTLNQGVEVFGDVGTELAAATSPHMPGFVTAMRNKSGNLQLNGWDYSWGVSIDPGDEVEGDAVSKVSIATANEFGGVVTAVRNDAGELQLASWSVETDESLITLQDEMTHLEAQEVEIVSLGAFAGKDRMLTAVKDVDDYLVLTTWEIALDGTISLLAETTAGTVMYFDVADGGFNHALTVARDLYTGDLLFSGWEIGSAGQITLHSELSDDAEKIWDIDLGAAMTVSPTTRQQATFVIKNNYGFVEIQSWEIGLEQ